MIAVYITIDWWREYFLLPLSTIKASQYIKDVIRQNRRLPLGNRARGDVGVA